MGYERANMVDLNAYVPGLQPREVSVLKLNTNENPFPPPGAVLEAIRAVAGDELRRYPDPVASTFCQKAAAIHGLGADQVIATNGGDELLRLAVTVFCQPRGVGTAATWGGMAVGEPSYALYPVLAAIHDTPLVSVPLTERFELPANFADRVVAAGCRLAVVANPHAPSGRLEPLDRLATIAGRLRGHAVLLIDEAYVDFAAADALALLDRASGLDNVLLLRSLSKGYSLAGLRFGYGLGPADLIGVLQNARDSYNTDMVAQVAATAALEHRDETARSWRAVIDQRQAVTGRLTRMGYRVFPSQSNFLLVVPPAGPGQPGARSIYQKLKDNGILVRYFDQTTLDDKLRLTVGTAAQNDVLLQALASL